MMHYRNRTLLCDKNGAKKRDKKYNKWRKGPGRSKRYRKLVKMQPKRR
jgi:hypothetical protein